MTTSLPSLCRVSIHFDGTEFDVTLPTGVPISALLPQLCDIAADHGAVSEPSARLLCVPGRSPLESAMTLAQSGIHDGSLLLLVAGEVAAPAVRHHDAAAALARAMPVDARWTPGWSRVAGRVTAVSMTGLAGFLVVPGPAAGPRLLLAAAAAAMASTLVGSLRGSGTALWATIAITCALVAVAMVPAAIFAVPTGRAGVGLAVLSVVLLSVAGRLSVALSGLSSQRHAVGADRDDGIRHAHRLHAILLSTTALSGVSGVVTAVCGTAAPGWPTCAFVAAVAAAMLLRGRSCRDPLPRVLLLGSGTACVALFLVAVQHRAPSATVPVCGTALAVAVAAGWLGQRSGPISSSPALHRGADAAGFAAPAAVLPLAAWAAGVYSAAPGWSPL